MKTKPSQPNRVNHRNQNITLRALLKVAIREMLSNGMVLPMPLRIWLESQPKLSIRPRQAATDLTVDLVEQNLVRRGLDGDNIGDIIEGYDTYDDGF